jgi:plastocyanin
MSMYRTGPLALAAAALMMACGGEQQPGTEAAPAAPAAVPAAAPGDPQTPDPGGKVITVEMITDATSNAFKPADFEAKKGDVIRYTLSVGAHNVHFLPDSNPKGAGLPDQPGQILQLPGQTWDVKVTWEPGRYFFQCDPHALLGMVGHVTVTK